MTFKPPIIVFDYETKIIGGGGSVEYYRDDFRVDSCAFSWVNEGGKITSRYIIGEEEVKKFLTKIVEDEIPLWAHNLQFEYGVTKCRYPDLCHRIKWGGDTMRLVQVYDNGGKVYNQEDPVLSIEEELDRALAELEGREYEVKPTKIKTGMGLVAAVGRILPKKYHDHKKEAHDWIAENVSEKQAKTKPGKFLSHLPLNLAENYNIGDTENTLRLYLHITDKFREMGYDYRTDHALYLGSMVRIVEAKIRGVPVNREALEEYRQEVENEIYEISINFTGRFAEAIAEVERDRYEKWVNECKTQKGTDGRKARVEADRKLSDPKRRTKGNKYDEKVKFNVGSNKQLAELFVGKLGMRDYKFKTDKGNPSFKSAFLHQWGDGGELLKVRRKRLLVMKQAENLLALSAYDGRWHPDLKAAGTGTGRMAGGRH